MDETEHERRRARRQTRFDRLLRKAIEAPKGEPAAAVAPGDDEAPSPIPTLLTQTTLSETRERLGIIGWGVCVIAACVAFYVLAATAVGGFSWDPLLRLQFFALGSAFLLSLAQALLAPSPRLRDAHLFRLGSLYMIFMSGLSGLFHASVELREYGHVTPVGPFVFAIALLPLVLPTGLRATLITAPTAAATALAGIFAGQAFGSGDTDTSILLEVAVGPVMGVIVAGLLAARITRLRVQMAEMRRLGSYQLEEKLGEGGMGEVWRATHHLLARPAAIKLVRSYHLDGLAEQRETVLQRFAREARTTAALGSSHTVDIYDFGITDDGTFFIAMELLDGIDLRALVQRFGPQPAGRVRAILLQACDSLGEAHEMGLIHRDVKPANVMICRQGRRFDVVKVLDFGIVAVTAQPSDSELTRTGSLLGTPAYLAPEVLGGGTADARSDVYALGCVAYWLLSGRLVFEHESHAQQIAAHLRDDPIPPSAFGVEVPPDLESVVLRCLAKDPDDRNQTADDLARHLAACSVEEWGPDQVLAWWRRHLPPDSYPPSMHSD